MAAYLSPGVYVEEVPSAIKAIAGVSTSTAGFIGVMSDPDLTHLKIPVTSKLVKNEQVGKGNGSSKDFALQSYPVYTQGGRHVVRLNGVPVGDDNAVTLTNAANKSTLTFATAPAAGVIISGDFVYDYQELSNVKLAVDGIPRLCTTFADFKKFYGDFSLDPGQRNLAHAVFGFFNNGGTRCWVALVKTATDIQAALDRLAAVDEVALVSAPGIVSNDQRSSIVNHCFNCADRFAILDLDESISTTSAEGGIVTDPDFGKLSPSGEKNVLPAFSDFAAAYFPWIQVSDPATKIENPLSDGRIYVPPSGHLAGIYARVDSSRGVHKAPANEAILGALGLRYQISKAQQDGLNPQGVNCLRDLNGKLLVWGARTIGGNANADLKYINVRRTLLFLRESIDEGTQWVVFEPNEPGLWQKITRNITAFLTTIWRSGALFGTTQQQAFYVKCNAETNPPELRELGQVVTEIGVSIVRPAEFVIFRISQFTEPGK